MNTCPKNPPLSLEEMNVFIWNCWNRMVRRTNESFGKKFILKREGGNVYSKGTSFSTDSGPHQCT